MSRRRASSYKIATYFRRLSHSISPEETRFSLPEHRFADDTHPLSPIQGDPRLIDDVLACIVETLALPPTEDAFEYEGGAVGALCSLSRVNQRLHAAAMRLLYERMYLYAPQQVDILVQHGIPQGVQVRFLALEKEALGSHAIRRFLESVAPTLERLLLVDPSNFPLDTLFSYDPHHPHIRLPRLWEFSTTYRYPHHLNINTDGLTVPVPDWPPITRHVTHKIGHHQFMKWFNTLETLVTVLYRALDVEQFDTIIRTHPNLREIVTIIPPMHPDYSLVSEQALVIKRDYARRYSGRLDLYDADPVLPRGVYMEEWLGYAIRQGTLWTLPKRNWLTNT